MPVRMLIADDHPLFRMAIAALLEQEAASDIAIDGEVAGGDALFEAVRTLKPDLILLDILMPGFDPLGDVPRLMNAAGHAQILVLTAHDGDAYVTGLIAAGIAGYVLKSEAPDIIIQAIRAVARGETWFSQQIAGRVIRSVWAPEGETSGDDGAAQLTPREHEILALIARGKTNSEIAEDLAISKATVQNYVSSIYTKLAIETRSQAVLYALRSNLVDVRDVIS
jgi:DNA-binding NarL/FixJ family response regulator